MGQDLPRPGDDRRGRRPARSSRHHLRNERRELPPARRARTQARPRPAADPRDNLGQCLIVAPRQSRTSIPLARQSHRDNDASAATSDSHPDCRSLPIQIAALHAYAMMSSPNLLGILERAVRYVDILSHAATLTIADDREGHRLILELFGGKYPVPRQRFEYDLMTILTFCRWVTNRDLRPLAFEF